MPRRDLALTRPGLLLVLACSLAGFPLATASAQQQPEKNNIELIGYNDLQSRSAYQPIIHERGERWIAYIGHHGGSRLNALTGQVESLPKTLVR